MKYYRVRKVSVETGKETDYGQNCYEDMKLITRGYKQGKDIPNFYNRENSKYFYIVDEI